MTHRIPQTTQSLIESFQRQSPVNVVGLADAMGLTVWSDDLGEKSGKLFPDPLNGGESGYSIVVNQYDAPTRQRFTIAHEIAHFVLHRGQIGKGVEDDTFYRSDLSNAIEAEANRLATEILMPYDLISALQGRGITGVQELASELEVSQAALKIQIGVPVFD